MQNPNFKHEIDKLAEDLQDGLFQRLSDPETPIEQVNEIANAIICNQQTIQESGDRPAWMNGNPPAA